MYLKRNTIVTLLLAGFMLVAPLLVLGADDFSLEDLEGLTPDQYSDVILEAFVLTLLDVQEVQLSMNMEVESIMQSGELEPERLVEIHQILGQGLDPQGISEQEIEAYEGTLSQIALVEQTAQLNMMEIVQEYGFTVDYYNLIISYAQEDQEFMARLQKLIEEVMG